MPRVFDCFTFFNELDLLEIRLNELDAVVDRFVLCESPFTFRGKAKPLVFAENRERFARFLPKILHVVVDDMPQGGSELARDYFRKERFQRNAIARGLGEAAPDDFVILCDVDEIPRASAIATITADPRRQVHVLEMRFYLYFLNLRYGLRWDKPRVARHGDIRRLQALRSGGPGWAPKSGRPLQVASQWRRMLLGVRPRPWTPVPDAGWHFTSMNGPASVHAKLSAYSHVRPEIASEMDVAVDIRRSLESALSGGPFSLDPVEELPAFVQANPARFADMLASADRLDQYRILTGVPLPKATGVG